MAEFDKILKENIEAVFLPLAEKMLGISIKETFEVKDNLQTTIKRETDFLKRVIDENGKEWILHLEFQTTSDPKMIYRMVEYRGILQRKYEIPVRQLVIYLGSEKPKMRTELSEEEQIRGFELQDIRKFSTQSMLDSEIPEGIILSILTDYKKADAEKVIEEIIYKLQKASKSESELSKSIQQLIVLSRLRKLEVKIKQKINDMPITYDIKTDGLYNEGIREGLLEGIEKGIEKGIQKGRKEGIEKGREEGREEGREKNRFQIISKALSQRVLTIEQIAEIAEVSIDYVLSVQSEPERKRDI